MDKGGSYPCFQETQSQGHAAQRGAPEMAQGGSFRCFQETQSQEAQNNVAAAIGTNTNASDNHQGCEPDPQPCDNFFRSGGTCMADDTEIALYITEKMPLGDNEDFNIIFNEKVRVMAGTFGKNEHFTIKQLCGSGAFGQVSIYQDTFTNQSFVRKTIKDLSKVRREEVKAMLMLKHPGICSVDALMVHNREMYIFMPYAGRPLITFLKDVAQGDEFGEQYWPIVLFLAKQGSQAIDHMHEKSVLHMDIKPQNFLVHLNEYDQPVLVLADFGSAIIDQQSVNLNYIPMTRCYMAPELWCVKKNDWNNNHLVQPSLDMFAFGATIYYMCTQKHLLVELQNKKVTVVAKYLSDLPSCGRWVFPDIPLALLKILIEVMRGTLDPDPGTRWTSQQVISFLTGKLVSTSTCKIQARFKTPVQVSGNN